MSDVAAEIKVGDTAPDFTLKDQDQKDVKLSEAGEVGGVGKRA